MTAATGSTDTIVRLRLPDSERVFHDRARRLAQLSSDHPAGPFLALLARIARGQHRATQTVRVPGGAQLLEGRPLDHRRWPLDASWREMLQVVLASATDGPLTDAAAAVTAHLACATDADLDAMAAGVLDGSSVDLAAAPFVGGALQVLFTRLAGGLSEQLVRPEAGACPVCGAGPVAGVILGSDRLRYLTCSLCATQWHLPRVQCARCFSGASLEYFGVEDALPGVSAEACDACGVYVKLFDLAEAHDAEPTADDAATLVLDLMLAERGYRRAGVNLIAPSGEGRQHDAS